VTLLSRKAATLASPDVIASLGRVPLGRGFFSLGGEMAFRLVHAKYDPDTKRAYVELRDVDDGGEVIATAIFSFMATANLTERKIEQEIVKKARDIFKKAGDTLSGG
jgi:hypothetical protein